MTIKKENNMRFDKDSTTKNLTMEQLEFIANCDYSFVVEHLSNKTLYDENMIRVMFDLSKEMVAKLACQLEYINELAVLEIVSQCFDCYASDFRSDGVKYAKHLIEKTR